jgi:hypothetical protein
MALPLPSGSWQPPLTPRNGHTLKVLGVARISTEHQNSLSPADQEALYRGWLDQHAATPYRLDMISGRGSGECLAAAKNAPSLTKKIASQSAISSASTRSGTGR